MISSGSNGDITLVFGGSSATREPLDFSISELFTAAYDDGSHDHQQPPLAGIAITANPATAADGSSLYSLDRGRSWAVVPRGTLSEHNALVLSAGARLAFQPMMHFLGETPALSVRLIDSSAGLMVTADVTGAHLLAWTQAIAGLDVSASGHDSRSAISAASVSLAMTVAAAETLVMHPVNDNMELETRFHRRVMPLGEGGARDVYVRCLALGWDAITAEAVVYGLAEGFARASGEAPGDYMRFHEYIHKDCGKELPSNVTPAQLFEAARALYDGPDLVNMDLEEMETFCIGRGEALGSNVTTLRF